MISTLLTSAFLLSSLTIASAVPNNFKRDAAVVRLPVAAIKINATDLLSYKRQVTADVHNVQTGTRYMVDCKLLT